MGRGSAVERERERCMEKYEFIIVACLVVGEMVSEAANERGFCSGVLV